ncbi:MAG: hypothetical protein KKF20_06490 [Bacteroidetes bacterium]|nr:hypothetical protein [Bacteroidota bacterium]MBU1423546.1 hypothetical protein [Bacteroidota bacterium]MBU2472038.1 hypothetical protein [Bacteroidota bacterium]MBU2636132.1 hypothetical protein [Bacteroidota bacterium]
MKFLLLVWKGGVIERFGLLRNALVSLGNEAKPILHPRSEGPVEFHGETINDKLSLKMLGKLKPDYIILWNGDLPKDDIVKNWAIKSDIPIIYVEMGWFPQEKTVYFDFRGVNASSEIRGIKLKRVSLYQRKKLHMFLQKYHQEMNLYGNKLPSDFIFVPLQVETDSNILKNSAIKTMKGLVERVASIFKDEIIIVRPHPKHPDVKLGRIPNMCVDTSSDLHNLVKKARVVVGINSTVLLEALTYFKPVVALGEGLFSNHNVLIEGRDLTNAEIIHEIKKLISKEKKARIEDFLYELIFKRTYYNEHLSDSSMVKNSHWYKKISRRL